MSYFSEKVAVMDAIKGALNLVGSQRWALRGGAFGLLIDFRFGGEPFLYLCQCYHQGVCG